MNDIWVCTSCKSINRQRDRHCYKCRASQDEAMPETGPSPRLESAAINRTVRPYLPSWPLAILAGALLVVVAVTGIALLLLQSGDYPQLRAAFQAALAGDPAGLDRAMVTQSAGLAGLALARTGLTLLALLSFAGWLALATLNVPALGGGVPSRGPVRVFIYTLIPIWNLVKVPGMVQDVLYRLDPKAGGAFMVAGATIGLLGSWLVSMLGTWIITASGIGSLVGAGSLEEAQAVFSRLLDQLFVLGIVTELMIAVGTLLLVVLMGRVEVRCARRDREIREAVLAG